MNWASYTDGLASLFEQGGLILWVILAASSYMWFLLVERYWFHLMQVREVRDRLRREWRSQAPVTSPSLTRRRISALAADLRTEASRNLLALQALVVILPLLGLLGTVSGMIKVFEVLTLFGSGNTRGMASGISQALITTMAGLFTALSGLYFVSDLERRADDVSRELESELAEDS